MKRHKKAGLSLKFTIGFILLGLLICATSCTIGYTKYKGVIEKMYNDTAYQVAHVAETYVDGDAIERYLETGVTDDAYDQSLAQLSALRERMGANYVYVARQVGIDLTYVMDAENPDDDYPPFTLGDTGQINPAFLEDSLKIVEKGERVDNYFYSHSQFGYNTSAIIPVYNGDKDIVAIIGVEISMEKLSGTLFEYVLYAIIISSLLIALFIVCYLLYLHKSVVRPIQSITHEASIFTENETAISEKLEKIQTGDEIQTLAEAVHKMELDINTYIQNLTAITAEKERIGAELGVATHIQASMLPCIFPAFPDRPEIDIYASMRPAKEVGGDFYDFFLVDDDHLAMVMADVSGKGVPAALFMVIAKTLLKNVAQAGLSPKDVLEKVNNQLCIGNEAEMFVTVWLGILEISTGKLRCANAGHEYPVLKTADGEYDLVKDKHGFVLAGMEGSRYKEYELQINPGDRLFLYTDGVPEATNAQNVLFDTDRMLQSLNQNKEAGCEEVLQGMERDIDLFVGEAPQFDDITMLCLEYRGKIQ